ncbi:MAG TPA: cytochrome c biogenesis protein [Bacteroidales bacterium]|nr:cytochrome c biogenesis protein [Bacteroidales bacterium]
MIKGVWWKISALVLLLYAVMAGFFITVPGTMMGETIRTVFFHVGMWFAMFVLLFLSFIYSLRYLIGFEEKEDIAAVEAANTAVCFGMLGIVTGMIWAKNTWGAFWVRDPKLDGALAGLFIYLAYLILRASVDDVHKRAKISAVYNSFAFILWMSFVLIMPRTAGSSIHPGQEGVPLLSLDLSLNTRLVFYPAMAGWILLGIWIMNLRIRLNKIQRSTGR